MDLARELGGRLGVPVEIVPYTTAGNLAAAVKTGAWDVATSRSNRSARTRSILRPAISEIETTYLVPAGSPLRSVDEVDREGVRVAVGAKGGPDLILPRTLKRAQLVRAPTSAGASKLFVSDKLDALAGTRPSLVLAAEQIPGSRVLDGRFDVVQQSAGTPKGCNAGAKYLREFAEDIKASGLVAQLIEKNGARGATVAPRAAP